MAIINKLLKSWLLAYMIAVIGQRVLTELFYLFHWLPLQQMAQQLSQYYMMIYAVIFAYLLFDDALYLIVSMILVMLQPPPVSFLIVTLGIIVMYMCQQMTVKTHELLGLVVSSTFLIILSLFILPLFNFETSLLIMFYHWVLALPDSIIKVLTVIILFGWGSLLPNDMNQLTAQLIISDEMIVLSSAACTIFIMSFATMCLYKGAIKESLMQSLLMPAIQLINVVKYPTLLVVPTITTIILSIVIYYIIPLNNSVAAIFYGSSFLTAFIDGAKNNGGGIWGWANVLTIYAILPILLTWGLTYTVDKLQWFTQISLKITRQTFQK